MRLRALVAACVALPGVLGAQVTTLDAGTFSLYRNGTLTGREQFTIARVPQGGTFALRATATVTIGTRQIVPALLTDTAGSPVQYKREARDSGRVVALVLSQITAHRFTGQIHADSGRAERELPVEPRAVVLDDDIVHQYYFLAMRPEGRIPVLAPARLAAGHVTVEARGAGNVDLGSGSLPSRHLTITDAEGVVTDLWVDRAGRVLRLAVASQGFVAVRDEPPR